MHMIDMKIGDKIRYRIYKHEDFSAPITLYSIRLTGDEDVMYNFKAGTGSIHVLMSENNRITFVKVIESVRAAI